MAELKERRALALHCGWTLLNGGFYINTLHFLILLLFYGVNRILSFCGLKHLERETDKQMVLGAATSGQCEEPSGILSRSGEHLIDGRVFLQNERQAKSLADLRCHLINAPNIWLMSRCAKSANEMHHRVSRGLSDKLHFPQTLRFYLHICSTH